MELMISHSIHHRFYPFSSICPKKRELFITGNVLQRILVSLIYLLMSMLYKETRYLNGILVRLNNGNMEIMVHTSINRSKANRYELRM